MDSNSEVVPQTEVVVTDLAAEEYDELLETSVEPSQSVNNSIDESVLVIAKESDQDVMLSDETPTTTIAIVDSIVVTDTETPVSETAVTENPVTGKLAAEKPATVKPTIEVVETEVENLTTAEIDASSVANPQDVPIDKTSNNAGKPEMEAEPQVSAKSQVNEVEEAKYEEETESEDGTESVTEEDIVETAIDFPEKSEVPSEVIESQTKKGTDSKEKLNESSDPSPQTANEVADVRLLKDQKNFNNQIQDIISDIDINIKTQEKITQLKEQELKLIQKQNELTNQIQQQQILAQQLTAQNQLKQKQWEQQQVEKQEFLSSQRNQRDGLSSTQSQGDDLHNTKETTNLSKSVDLRKIFTPATDAIEILPKNHYQQYQSKPATSPNILPAYSDAGKHRVQLNIHQDQLIEKYSKPGLQVVKSPWEAALQTGSASSAFLEESKPKSLTPSFVPKPYFHSGGSDFIDAAEPVSYEIPLIDKQESYNKQSINQHVKQQSSILPTNPQRELAYKPSVAQGWGGRNVELPRGLYVPKEISLASYAPPPKNFTDKQPAYPGHNISNINTSHEYSHQPLPKVNHSLNETSMGTSLGFPVSKPIATGFSTIPPKQQLSTPASYQKIPQTSAQGAPPVNFNPSPLSYEKLSKFEQSNLSYPNQNQNYLNARQSSQVRNASPTPFGSNHARFSVEHASRSPSSIASISPQPLRSPCVSTRYGQPSNSTVPRLTSSSQAQTFNNCARGWVTEPENQCTYPGQNVLPAQGNMPYSDF
ncbi:myb-like protein P isoform X15 [Drosophila pseudoobscura]|uniref:Myb-like protein P isoform X15 n=1 Tax=Drosophila pseudoobscura pseudoobscura TaxID=46245 RepID=A0A0R3NWG1_DROPS|nr:myb-like protein P isoform X15 [Drosophila pseudoobscura]